MVRANARVAHASNGPGGGPCIRCLQPWAQSATVWAVVSACDASVGIGGKPAVGKEALQTDIAARLANAGQQPQSVTCEHDLVGEVGKTARCEVVMSPTNSFEPVITVTGVDGNTINYEMSPALSKEQLEKEVSRLVADAAHAQVASVSCESGLEGKVGATVALRGRPGRPQVAAHRRGQHALRV